MPFLLGFKHPFYVSVTEVEYTTKTKELGITCKIYQDNLQEALKPLTSTKIDLVQGNKGENNKMIEAYIRKHVSILINGQQKAIQYLGYENDNDATWIFFTITSLKNVKSIGVTTDLLYEYKTEFTNIIHITIDGKRKSFKLNSPETAVSAMRE